MVRLLFLWEQAGVADTENRRPARLAAADRRQGNATGGRVLVIVRETSELTYQTWRVTDGGKQYWVSCRRAVHGPVWGVSVFVVPKSDQKPYWRAIRGWQKVAGEVRAYENRSADF